MLIVLIGLEGNAGERGGAADAGRLAQRAVARSKSVLEEFMKVDLTAGRCQRQEIHVMDVDVAVVMGLGLLRAQDEDLVEVFGALGPVAQHGPHGRVAVDVGVLALQVVVPRVAERQLLIDVHEAAPHLPHAAAPVAVEDIEHEYPHAHFLDGLVHSVLLPPVGDGLEREHESCLRVDCYAFPLDDDLTVLALGPQGFGYIGEVVSKVLQSPGVELDGILSDVGLDPDTVVLVLDGALSAHLLHHLGD